MKNRQQSRMRSSHPPVGICLQPLMGVRMLSETGPLSDPAWLFFCFHVLTAGWENRVNGLMPTVLQGCAYRSDKPWLDLLLLCFPQIDAVSLLLLISLVLSIYIWIWQERNWLFRGSQSCSSLASWCPPQTGLISATSERSATLVLNFRGVYSSTC